MSEELITDEEGQFIVEYLNYLCFGCKPRDPNLRRALEEGPTKWMLLPYRERVAGFDAIRDEVVSALEFAQSDEMAWELPTVAGQDIDFAEALREKLLRGAQMEDGISLVVT